MALVLLCAKMQNYMYIVCMETMFAFPFQWNFFVHIRGIACRLIFMKSDFVVENVKPTFTATCLCNALYSVHVTMTCLLLNKIRSYATSLIYFFSRKRCYVKHDTELRKLIIHLQTYFIKIIVVSVLFLTPSNRT